MKNLAKKTNNFNKLNKTLVLTGIKHCGKSTQGKLLSSYFGCGFFDTDDLVTEMTGKTPREIYSEEGRDAFMKAEFEACKFLASKDGVFVVSTGGGICNNESAVAELKKIGVFIFLNSDEATACDRIIKEAKILDNGELSNLPAYIAKENPKSIDDVRNSFHNFYVERQKIYKSLCDIEVEMLHLSKTENMERIASAVYSA